MYRTLFAVQQGRALAKQRRVYSKSAVSQFGKERARIEENHIC